MLFNSMIVLFLVMTFWEMAKTENDGRQTTDD